MHSTKKAWICDWKFEIWSFVGNMNFNRRTHACSLVPKVQVEQSDKAEYYVGIVGGLEISSNNVIEMQKQLQRMELFDPVNKSWNLTRHDLPVLRQSTYFGAAMNLVGRLPVLTGGESLGQDSPHDFVFEYHPIYGFRLMKRHFQFLLFFQLQIKSKFVYFQTETKEIGTR